MEIPYFTLAIIISRNASTNGPHISRKIRPQNELKPEKFRKPVYFQFIYKEKVLPRFLLGRKYFSQIRIDVCPICTIEPCHSRLPI